MIDLIRSQSDPTRVAARSGPPVAARSGPPAAHRLGQARAAASVGLGLGLALGRDVGRAMARLELRALGGRRTDARHVSVGGRVAQRGVVEVDGGGGTHAVLRKCAHADNGQWLTVLSCVGVSRRPMACVGHWREQVGSHTLASSERPVGAAVGTKLVRSLSILLASGVASCATSAALSRGRWPPLWPSPVA
jgi:hypothetical protein